MTVKVTTVVVVLFLTSLAPSAQTGTDFVGVSSEGLAVRIDGETSRTTRISGVGLQGYRSVAALECNSAGTVFAVDNRAHELLTINSSNRQTSPIGGIGFFRISDLAFHGPTGAFYAIDDEVDATRSDRLIRIDAATGMGTLVGEIGPSYRYVLGLAFDSATGNLLATDIAQHELIRINRLTGVGTRIGTLNFGNVTSLAFSPAGALYGIDQTGDQLVRIDKATGQGTVVGPLGFFDVKGLAFGPDGVGHGMDALTGQFLRVASAQSQPGQLLATQLGPLGFQDVKGLTLVRTEGTLYATDCRNHQLLRIHPITAQVTVVGPLRRPNVLPYASEVISGMTCLAFKPGGASVPAKLFGADENRDRLYVINRATAQIDEDMGPLLREDGTTLYALRALAWDTQLRTLFGINHSTTEELVRRNAASGRWTVVGSVYGYTEIRGMVYVPSRGLLTASAIAADGSHQAIAINRANAAVLGATTLDVRDVYGVVHDPVSLGFAGVASPRNQPSQLYELDVYDGGWTTIGALGTADIEGMASDPSTGVVYGTSAITAANPVAQLVRVQPNTGQATVIGPVGYSVSGLAYDPVSRTLYGSVSNVRKLVRIDTTTGQGTILADLRWSNGQVIQDCAGLAYDASARVLFGVDGATDKLIRIDPATGIGTAAPNALGFPDVEGLEFDPQSGFLFGTDVQTFQMIRIDKTTGIGTAVGSTGYKVDGLARLP